MLLFSNRSLMMSKCGKNKKVAHEAQPSVSLMILPHFDVLCDPLLNRRTATWNLFVLCNEKYTEKMPFYFKFCHFDRHENSMMWSNVYTKWSELIGCYAYSKELWLIQIQNSKKLKKTWIERCRHVCVCPLIDHTNQNMRVTWVII